MNYYTPILLSIFSHGFLFFPVPRGAMSCFASDSAISFSSLPPPSQKLNLEMMITSCLNKTERTEEQFGALQCRTPGSMIKACR